MADTAKEDYTMCKVLFGIFDTEEEALAYVLSNPGKFGRASFDFFEDFDEVKMDMSKEKYAERYIYEFTEPSCIAYYAE